MHNQNDALTFAQITLSHELNISNLIVSQITNECNRIQRLFTFKNRMMKKKLDYGRR